MKKLYRTKAFVPNMPWIDNRSPKKVCYLKVSVLKNKVSIKWQDSLSNESMYYIVYRFNGNKIGNINDPNNIIAIIKEKRDKER
ncbi:hypothetical protein PL321_03550 [Caloramator sp. mosi_1]|uniref:hypothetical protein n=1 Tax=Caloramator sp. mosi_1 TaxID=3023090 RepID=UPI0023629C8A|nr:hypothetical protein [Caloramator sp. mosi_1]WDC84738.1 hypothetical protein PL321_03550 [Caloramator sp. mosi_1]